MTWDLSDRYGLILGVANKHSLAWAVAAALGESGAGLCLTYQNERLRDKVASLAGGLPQAFIFPCDVTEEDQLDALFDRISCEWGRLDFILHSVAYAPREDLSRPFLQTSWPGFSLTQQISVHSLGNVTRRAASLMKERGGSVVTMTYLGSERVVPGYNLMGVAKAALEAAVRYLAHDVGEWGIRVNAVSAGPVSTLAARGVPGFTDMLGHHEEKAPLRRNVTHREVADAACFLLSPLSSGITGEVLHVDAGYNIMGM